MLNVLPAEGSTEDSAVGFSGYYENDGGYITPVNSSDRWYTAAVGGAVQWKSETTSDLVGAIPSFGGEYDEGANRDYSAGILFALTMFTPSELTDPNPRPDDRPYCGWTYMGFMVQRANRDLDVPTMEHIQLDIGTMGERSRAGDAQKWVHTRISPDSDYPQGWEYQTQDEWGADVRYIRRWQFQIMEASRPHGPEADLIPDAGFTVGTIHTNASGGATLRFGWNLPSDFGPGQLNRPADFTRPLSRSDGLNFGDISGYFYIRPGMRLVGHDSTYGDSYFHDNEVEVDPNPVVGEITAGIAITFLRHCQFTWSETLVSPEFEEQNSWHQYGSLMLSFVYTR